MEQIQYLFYSDEDLDEVLTEIFTNLGIDNIDKDKLYKLKFRDHIKYDLLIDVNNKTIDEICNIILGSN